MYLIIPEHHSSVAKTALAQIACLFRNTTSRLPSQLSPTSFKSNAEARALTAAAPCLTEIFNGSTLVGGLLGRARQISASSALDDLSKFAHALSIYSRCCRRLHGVVKCCMTPCFLLGWRHDHGRTSLDQTIDRVAVDASMLIITRRLLRKPGDSTTLMCGT